MASRALVSITKGDWGKEIPFRPCFFILAADTLQALIQKAGPHFYTVPIVRTVAYQFVNDTAIITETHPKKLHIIKFILDTCAKMSGLHINLNKSTFIPIAVQ